MENYSDLAHYFSERAQIYKFWGDFFIFVRLGGRGVPRIFLRGVPEAWIQKYLPPKFIFSSDLGHFIFEIGENCEKKYKRNKKVVKFYS